MASMQTYEICKVLKYYSSLFYSNVGYSFFKIMKPSQRRESSLLWCINCISQSQLNVLFHMSFSTESSHSLSTSFILMVLH